MMAQHIILKRSFWADITNGTCPEVNTAAVDHSHWWQGDFTSSQVKLGWSVSLGFVAATCLVAGWNVWRHCRNYRKPLEQRQIIRMLLTPIVFAVASWLGFFWYRDAVYFEVVRDGYEGLTIAAFMVLMMLYLSSSPIEQRELLASKEKRRWPFPFGCWRFRPSKPKFFVNVRWSVMQYAVIKPLLAVVSVITEAFDVYCAASWSLKFASAWIAIIDFVSISIALYGLFLLYALIKPELQGHRPLAKFMTIKIIVALVFYQGFLFSVLNSYGLLHETLYWSADNIAEGLNFFVTTIEMLLIAVFQLYAFPVSEYRIVELHDPAAPRVALGPTSFWRSFSHSQNYADFFVDVYLALRFYVDSLRGKEYTRRNKEFEDDRKLLGGNDLDLETAFFGGMPDAPTGLPTRSHHPHGGGDKDVSDLADRNALAGVSSRASSRRASVDGVGLPTLAYRGRTPSVDIGGDEDAEKVWADARRVNEGEKK